MRHLLSKRGRAVSRMKKAKAGRSSYPRDAKRKAEVRMAESSAGKGKKRVQKEPSPEPSPVPADSVGSEQAAKAPKSLEKYRKQKKKIRVTDEAFQAAQEMFGGGKGQISKQVSALILAAKQQQVAAEALADLGNANVAEDAGGSSIPVRLRQRRR